MRYQLASLTLVLLFGIVLVQARTEYRDKDGKYLGSSSTWRDTTTYRDKTGLSTGKAVTNGSRVEHYDAHGLFTGSSRTTEPRR
jgi:hypothetical protein